MCLCLPVKSNKMMSTKKDYCAKFEYDSKDFFSLSLMQQSFRSHINSNAFKIFPNMKSLLKNPNIFVLRHPSEGSLYEDMLFLVDGNQKARRKHRATQLCKDFKTPFAVVVLLQLKQANGTWNLSNEDCALLDNYQNLLKDLTNVVYIVKTNHHETEFSNNILRIIGADIDKLVFAKGCSNSTFSRLFLEHDRQIPIRIGLCVNESALLLLKSVHECIEKKVKEIHQKISFMSEPNNNENSFLKCQIHCNYDLNKEMDAEYQPVRKRKKTTDMEITNTKEVAGRNHLPYKLTEPEKRMMKEKRKLTEKYKDYKDELERRIKKRKLKWTIKMKDYKTLDEMILNEINITDGNLELHEWKIVALRNDKVKGFGFGNNTVEIYLENKNNVESYGTGVIQYLQKYLNLASFQYRICYKDKKLILYTQLEQGSKILPANNSDSYGSLGIFFTDGKGQYFFSTCDHVIGKDMLAYSYLDKTKIGRNVFACHPNYMNDDQIDFSLVLLSPEKSVQVALALKKAPSTDKGTKVEIFRGDISEIRNRYVYKWGATSPHYQEGRCISFVIENDCTFSLEINTENFAKKGDSGSVICIDNGIGKCLAGFVIIGGNGSDNPQNSTITVYKVAEAIRKVHKFNRDIKPCCILDLEKSQISIPGSAVTTTVQDTNSPKRKRQEKVLEPRPKRLSPRRLSPQRLSPRRKTSPHSSLIRLSPPNK